MLAYLLFNLLYYLESVYLAVIMAITGATSGSSEEEEEEDPPSPCMLACSHDTGGGGERGGVRGMSGG